MASSREEDFSILMNKLVYSYAVDETVAYEAIQSDLLQAMFHSPKETHGRYEFGVESAIAGLKILGLAWGTFKTLKEIYREVNHGKTVHPAEIRDIWAMKLRLEGLPPETADRVAQDFAQYVHELCKR